MNSPNFPDLKNNEVNREYVEKFMERMEEDLNHFRKFEEFNQILKNNKIVSLAYCMAYYELSRHRSKLSRNEFCDDCYHYCPENPFKGMLACLSLMMLDFQDEVKKYM